MPRSESTTEAKILRFFKDAPLPIATLVLDLAKDEVKSRAKAAAPVAGKTPTARTRRNPGIVSPVPAEAAQGGSVAGQPLFKE
jgi:hypothetical protein